MRLYTFFRSSAAFRVRIALNLKGIEYERVTVHLPQDEHHRAEFLAINPLATVPVLDDAGTVLTQSLAIIEYLDALRPEPRLIPAEPAARARVQAFAQVIACDVHPLNNLRVLRYLRSELALDEPAVRRWYRHWIADAFAGLETLLARSAGRYAFGDAVSLADVYLVPQVYNARRFECDLSAYPTIGRIADRVGQEPAFAAAAPENQPDAE
jgi:maleylacetoacetate isomerase